MNRTSAFRSATTGFLVAVVTLLALRVLLA